MDEDGAGKGMSRLDLGFEIVKTLAIGIGVAVALWELVIKDREEDRLRAEFTLGLVQADLSPEMLASKTEMADFLFARRSRPDYELNAADAAEMERIALPQLHVMFAWEACFAAGLCEEEVGLAYICQRALSLRDLYSVTIPMLTDGEDRTNPSFRRLAERCAAWMAGSGAGD